MKHKKSTKIFNKKLFFFAFLPFTYAADNPATTQHKRTRTHLCLLPTWAQERERGAEGDHTHLLVVKNANSVGHAVAVARQLHGGRAAR